LRDFSFDIYRLLIRKLKKAGYKFKTLQDYIADPSGRVVLIRHDIDLVAASSLRFAKVEKELGIQASYYFRSLNSTFKPDIIRKVATLGHEIGYHYEDLSRNNGDIKVALAEFGKHLRMFRKLYPVKTVCMHGSSGSPYDPRDMWKAANLADYDLIAEPYLSLDFNKVLYLSDTSQRWNGNKVAMRDKVQTDFQHSFTTTWDIMDSINKLPDQVMLTMHPELWTNSLVGWWAIKIIFMGHSLYKTKYRNLRVKRQQAQRDRKNG